LVSRFFITFSRRNHEPCCIIWKVGLLCDYSGNNKSFQSIPYSQWNYGFNIIMVKMPSRLSHYGSPEFVMRYLALIFGCCLLADVVAAAVLSGNRNFEGRVHPLTRANYLAYAFAGTVGQLSHFFSGSNFSVTHFTFLVSGWTLHDDCVHKH
jgi:hypothetical protein